jgi:hypothetical protein
MEGRCGGWRKTCERLETGEEDLLPYQNVLCEEQDLDCCGANGENREEMQMMERSKAKGVEQP